MEKNFSEKLTYYSRKYLVVPLDIRWSGVLFQPKSTDGYYTFPFRSAGLLRSEWVFVTHTHTHTHTLSLSLSLCLSLEVADTQRDSMPITHFRDLFLIRLYQGLKTYGTLTQNVTRRDFLGTLHSLLTHVLFRLPDQCLYIVKIIWLRTDSTRSTVATK